jgi:hypothetical protein
MQIVSYCCGVRLTACSVVAIGWAEGLFCAFCLAFLLACLVRDARERRRKRAVSSRLSEREALSSDEFGDRFFAPDGRRAAVSSALRELLEADTGLPLAGLRPDDSLEDILGCRASADPPFFLGIEERLSVDTSVSEERPFVERTRGITTFRDLVDFVADCPPKKRAT